ncbi:MAG TPA: DUF5666 domain-containing protein [Caldilineaceae bacterium]|nr:DUF5666 domain-containing protein [Caldilineaceae bacterium]
MNRQQWCGSTWRLSIGGALVMALLLALFGQTGIARADGLVWRGVIQTIPEGGREGQWQVGGRTFVANVATEFDVAEGPLTLNGCAKVSYVQTALGDVALEIDSEPAGDCDGDGNGDDNDDGNDDGNGDDSGNDDGEHIKVYGRIGALPLDGLVGVWTIDGAAFTTNLSTKFEPEHGGFAEGVCVEVKLAASTLTVVEIESEEDYKCSGRDNGDDDTAEGQLYGEVTAFPSGLVGDWVIGGKTFVATAETRFDPQGQSFAQGVTVKVEFFTDANDTNIATAIEIKLRADDDDEDGDFGDNPGDDGHAFGKVDQRPAGLVGVWIIGGVAYTATEHTEFDDEGSLAVGVQVKVEFTVNAQGERIAHEIEQTDDDGDVSGEGHLKLVGFVNQMPASGFLGVWIIGGVQFSADQTTRFKAAHGAFGQGAYVEVEYVLNGDVRLIYEIETHVPPAAGDTTRLGRIEAIVDRQTAATIEGQGAVTWQIGGVSYTITPATQLVDNSGELTVGAEVLVNSYTADNGGEVATQIRHVALNNRVYLPLTLR